MERSVPTGNPSPLPVVTTSLAIHSSLTMESASVLLLHGAVHLRREERDTTQQYGCKGNTKANLQNSAQETPKSFRYFPGEPRLDCPMIQYHVICALRRSPVRILLARSVPPLAQFGGPEIIGQCLRTPSNGADSSAQKVVTTFTFNRQAASMLRGHVLLKLRTQLTNPQKGRKGLI